MDSNIKIKIKIKIYYFLFLRGQPYLFYLSEFILKIQKKEKELLPI